MNQTIVYSSENLCLSVNVIAAIVKQKQHFTTLLKNDPAELYTMKQLLETL